MIKLKSIEKAVPIQVDIDPYVLLDVKFIGPKEDPKIYWRAGNGKTSLLEIGFLSSTGAISSITLVNISHDQLRFFPNLLMKELTVPGKQGLPTFSRSLWENIDNYSDRFCEEFNLDFTVSVGSDFIEIQIIPDGIKYQSIQCGNVLFYFNQESALVSIMVGSIAPEQLEYFRS